MGFPAKRFCSRSLSSTQALVHVRQRTGFIVRGTPEAISRILLRVEPEKLSGRVSPQMPQQSLEHTPGILRLCAAYGFDGVVGWSTGAG